MTPLTRPRLLAGLLLSLCAAPAAFASHPHEAERAAYGHSSDHDPSGRAARLNHMQGEVSYSPAGEDEWINVVRNRPLVRGDRLWTDRAARAELQVGGAAIRLGADTSVEFLDLSDRVAQVRLTQGTLNLRVRRLHPGQSYEIATPDVAFIVTRAGRYRIDVGERDGQATAVVWEGAAEAYGDGAHFALRAGEAVRFYGADLRDHDLRGAPRADAFDRYCLARDRQLDRSVSLRYLDEDVVGYADLDAHGRWRPVRGYGTVWFPRVEAGWAPYHDGRWIWQEPWGWTWVDEAPWGFAPSHYGRWAYLSNRWGWIPGPRNVRPVYAPAVVAFVSGRGWSVSVAFGAAAPIGWFPLAPREVYVPSYRVSRDYFTRINTTSTVVNNTTITNVYNNSYVYNNYGDNNTHVTRNTNVIRNTQVTYANRGVAGAVTAVPSSVFTNAEPVRPAAIRVEGPAVTTADITRVAPAAPSVRSVLGGRAAASARPPREAQQRRVVARSAPPPAAAPFAAREPQQQQEPQRAPGPVAEAAVVSAPTPAVRVIVQPDAVDARAAGSKRAGGGRSEARADKGARPLPALERNAAPEPAVLPEATAAPPAPVTAAPEVAGNPRTPEAGQDQREHKASDDERAAQASATAAAETRERELRQGKVKTDEQAKVSERQQRAELAERERRVAEQHRVEQQRLDAEQQKDREGKAEGNRRQLAEAQRLERQRLADARKLEQAECERIAAEKKQDPRPCRGDDAPGKKKPPRADKSKARGGD